MLMEGTRVVLNAKSPVLFFLLPRQLAFKSFSACGWSPTRPYAETSVVY